MKKSLITIAISISVISVATDYFALIKKEKFNVIENPLWIDLEPTYTIWIDTINIDECSTWEPEISQQKNDFIQSAQCDVIQERIKNNLQENTIDGTIKTTSQEIENMTVNKIKTRNIIVTNIEPVEEVSNYNCDEWTPYSNNFYIGTIFEQERYCDIDLMQKWRYHSNSLLIGTWEEKHTEQTGYETQKISGTKEWEKIDTLYTNWIDTGVSTCEEWTPMIGNQTSSFSQSQSCIYQQERIKKEREENPITEEINIISEEVEEKNETRIENRNISVSSEPIIIEKNNYNCDTWTPDSDTALVGDFIVQERYCDVDKMKKWNYESDNILIETFEERYTEKTGYETQNKEGTHISNSCKDIIDHNLDNGNGMYNITPKTTEISVYCDMTNGGYSIYNMSNDIGQNTPSIEASCASVGMKLFVPRTEEHLTNAILTLGSSNFLLMGIYPNEKGAKCNDLLFTSDTCSTWSATDGGKWFVKGDATHTEPNGDNDPDYSMFYVFNQTTGLSLNYNDVSLTNKIYPEGYKVKKWSCSAIGEENIL